MSPFIGRFGTQVDTLAVFIRARLSYPQTSQDATRKVEILCRILSCQTTTCRRSDSPTASVAASVSGVKSYILSLGVWRRRYIIDDVYLRRLSLFAHHSSPPPLPPASPILALGSSSSSAPSLHSSIFLLFPFCLLNLCFVVNF